MVVNRFLIFDKIARVIILLILTAFAVLLVGTTYEEFMATPQLSITRQLGVPWMPTFGLKTSLWHLVHGQFRTALEINPLSVIILPLLIKVYTDLSRPILARVFSFFQN